MSAKKSRGDIERRSDCVPASHVGTPPEMKVLQEPSRHRIHPSNRRPLASHYHTRKVQTELRCRQYGAKSSLTEQLASRSKTASYGDRFTPFSPFTTIHAAAKTSRGRWSIRCGRKRRQRRLLPRFPPRAKCPEFRMTAAASKL